MNRGVYTAANGMTACQEWLDVISHNLANASTTGYKRDGVAFGEMLQRELRLDGGLGASAGTMSSGPVAYTRFTVMDSGNLTPTDNALDVAIADDRGAFAVQTAAGVRFTRDGAFSQDSQGRLLTKIGDPVLDLNLRPIVLSGTGPVQIDERGSISQGGQVVGTLGVFDGEFEKEGASLFVGTDTRPSNARVRAGALEESNVNAVEAMVQMITLNRAFEMAQKAVTAQDEQSQRLIQSLRNA